MAREDSAPEVAFSSQPERRWAGDSEVLQHTGIDGKEARIAASSDDREASKPVEKSGSKWVALAVGAIAAVIGLGIGVGIGYAAGDNNTKAAASPK